MRKRRRRNTIIWSLIAVIIVVAGWFSFGPGLNFNNNQKVVTVGVVGESKQEEAIWKSVAKTAKEKQRTLLIIINQIKH